MLAIIDPRFSRVCEVVEKDFPIAEPLFFTPCRNDCISDFDYWNSELQVIVYPPRPEPEVPVDLVGTTVEEF
jgi:hypothetical protein